jgi:sugar/nucleoside kinase (ribokinase family)
MSSAGARRRQGVTVIGGVQADVVIRPVTELPPPGATRLTEEMSIFVETGLPVRLMGCVGEDRLGEWMRQELADAGLVDELTVLPGRATGLTVALESDERDRTFLTHLGVNAHWVAEMIPADALECDNLLLCDYCVTPGLQGEVARSLLQATRAAGGRTFFDTAWDPEDFPPATRAELRDLLGQVDVFLPNEAEARAIADEADVPAAARALQAASGGWVVVKLGARGCLAMGPDGAELSASAPAVAVAADTTGAGDAFNAGLVTALSGNGDWAAAIEAATRFATEIVSRPSHERWRPPLLDGSHD